MLIRLKDVLKLSAVAVVMACAVFVSTLFLNFYFDVAPLRSEVSGEADLKLYEAQLALAKIMPMLAGGILSAVAAVMLIFYLKLYIDEHLRDLGVFKAMGYSEKRLALSFLVFGLAVFVGCGLGFGLAFACMRFVYDKLQIGALLVPVHFHVSILFAFVVAPTVAFSLISYLYAAYVLRLPVMQMMRGRSGKEKPQKKEKSETKERPFLRELAMSTLSSKKSLAFFVAFASFCFSAMTQMAFSMDSISETTMAGMILFIGLVLAVTTMLLVAAALMHGNAKNISMLRAFGYSVKQCALGILLGYVPLAAIGFALGTVYQWGLLRIMVDLVFQGVEGVGEYSFDVPVFFAVLAAFIVFYAAINLWLILKIKKTSVKKVMIEE